MATARPEGYALRQVQLLDALLRGGGGPLLGAEAAAAPVAAPSNPQAPAAESTIYSLRRTDRATVLAF